MPANNAQQVVSTITIGGKYRVIRLLGKGGMGSVYEAENAWTKRRVAVKVMRPEVAAMECYAQRFLREAQAATRLAHPNIVDVLDMGRDDTLESLFIVQEFLIGHDLRQHLEAVGPLPVDKALALIVPVMEALVVAHAHGIIHRDLKPDNIFLAETPHGLVPKLIDFGIAKLVDGDADVLQKTSTGVVMGTPYYMSPEQACGESDLDARSDIWSLGVVLYAMLAGVRPFQATSGNALIAKIIYEDPLPLRQAASNLPRELTDVVMGALRKRREERYPTMQAFLDAVRACSGSGAALRTAPFERDIAEASAGSAPAPSAPRQDRAHASKVSQEAPSIGLSLRASTAPPARVLRPRNVWAAGIGALGVCVLALTMAPRRVRASKPSAYLIATAAIATRTPATNPTVEAAAPASIPRMPAPPPPVAIAEGLSGASSRHRHASVNRRSEGHSFARGAGTPSHAETPTQQPQAVGPTGVPILEGN